MALNHVLWGCGMFYSLICFIIAAGLLTALSIGLSGSYGGEREPSYDEAARLAGYFDSDGVYQGGVPEWTDYSEDAYACHDASQNGKYCQAWSTERYYSRPEQEFLKGNCTCIRPLDNTVELTFDAWYNLDVDSQTTSSSEAALQDANFCSAWNCQEIRYTEQCTCTEYETRSSCRRRQLRTRSGRGTSGSGSSCGTKEVCVAYVCEYVESDFFTACDCDSNGQRRAEWGPDWWREFTHCEKFSCVHSNVLVTMNESFALSSSVTEYASLPPENASMVPTNAAVVTGRMDGVWAMDYTCTQQTQVDDSAWCHEWSGMTLEEDYEVVQQLCGCTDQDTGNSGEFCEEWTCTTYYMDACSVCWLEGLGGILAGVILMGLAPLYSCMARGYIAQPLCATPFGLAAASLVAVYFGGLAMIWIGVVPAVFLSVVVGWCMGKIRPTRVDPQPATGVEGYEDVSTPRQQPVPVTGLGPPETQTYQQTALTAEPATQPGFSVGGTAGGYSYTPPGSQQHPTQYYSAPTIPGGYNSYAAYGGGNQGNYGGGLQAGAPNAAPPANRYGYQNPAPFKTGVDGGPNEY